MIETWKDIEGFEGSYQVSSLGRIKSMQRYVKHPKGGLSLIKERFIKQVDNGNGYWYVTLWKDNFGDGFLVHRLIAIAFIPNPENKLFINHKDGNKANNELSNIEWCTKSENAFHAYATGLSKKRVYGQASTAKKVINTETGEITTSIKEVSDKIGMSWNVLRNQLVGRTPNTTIYKLYTLECA